MQNRHVRHPAHSQEWLCHVMVGVAGCVLGMAMMANAQAPSRPDKTRPLEANPVGIFESHRDVGEVAPGYAGNTVYDAAKKTYTLSASGENVWFGKDAFQFAWKRMSGDVTVSADIEFLGAGKNPHRKALLMIRQNLEADSVYADVALHGVGMTALQYRDEKGALTHEVQANMDAPKRVRIVKRGDYFTMWVAGADGKFELAGATGKIALKEPFYVGIGMCSHEKDVMETAVFSKVELKENPPSKTEGGAPAQKGDLRTATSDQKTNASGAKAQEQRGANVAAEAATHKTGAEPAKLYSMMEIMDAESTDRRAIYVAEAKFEAPNWMPDGKYLIFNRKGRIEKIAVTGGPTETIDTGFAAQCNNDHGISPDGKWLVVSDQSQDGKHQSQVYILPIGGGTPRLITKNSPSYWHGWSPDGKTLAFVGQRNGEFDIYAISTEGGEEKQLTTAKGLDDGPEYTPDGQWIYFNSVRTGQMHIWKMKADGSEQTQVTFDDANDWFPHFSPDGEKMVFLTFDKSVEGHPENKDVMLRMMTMKDGKIRVMGKLFGGQGTINVPSWSPDGKKFAFVSYALIEKED